MKIVITIAVLAFSSASFARTPGRTMDWVCQETLITALGEGTLEMSTPEIIRELKEDWAANPLKQTTQFGYCGNSEFFNIVVDKISCEIVTLEGGDSDGDCHEFTSLKVNLRNFYRLY